MKTKGATIVDPVDIPSLGKFDSTELEVMLYEFKADLQKYLAWLGPASPVHSLRDVIAFNEAHKDQEMPYFGQELMIQSDGKRPLTDPKYRTALAKNHRLARTLGIDAVMAKHRLDALVAPSLIPAWLIDLVNGDSVPFTAVRISAHHRASGVRSRPAGGHLLLRPRVERADAPPHRLRVRAGDKASTPARVCAQR